MAVAAAAAAADDSGGADGMWTSDASVVLSDEVTPEEMGEFELRESISTPEMDEVSEAVAEGMPIPAVLPEVGVLGPVVEASALLADELRDEVESWPEYEGFT